LRSSLRWGRLQDIFTSTNGDFVVANSMSGGPIEPGDQYNLKVLYTLFSTVCEVA
jgi:hypothetical protein